MRLGTYPWNAVPHTYADQRATPFQRHIRFVHWTGKGRLSVGGPRSTLTQGNARLQFGLTNAGRQFVNLI